MRYWLPSVALCACVSGGAPASAPVTGSALNPVSSPAAAPVAAPPSPTSPLASALPVPPVLGAPAEGSSESAAASGSTASSSPAQSSPAQSSPAQSSGASSPAGEGSNQLAEQILARPDLAAYHGWIRYLQFRAAHASERYDDNPGAVVGDWLRLKNWTRKILDNPNVLGELRGVNEWAYLSPVDGSGQPFQISIPTDYDPAKPAPMTIRLHGRVGNHLEDAGDMREHPGGFELSVLGRSRGGLYRALSEADTVQALEYVTSHWSVDRDRIHLLGGGMGGTGTLWLASRYPQEFASGRDLCGSANDKPLGNLLTFPIYAMHSEDDYLVPVLQSRGPLAKLRALGGNVTLDTPTGYGHSIWNFAEGAARADAWYARQVRPASRQVKRLDFTALDGGAVRAFWAEVAEWGPEAKPARFALEVTGKNQINARLENVTSLRLRLAEAPVEPGQSLRVSIEGAPPLTLPAPLPAEAFIEHGAAAWSLVADAPTAPFRLHAPGGANQLYDGEPLLIVYGTGGDDQTQAALRTAAEAASRSSSASWPRRSRERGDDGIAHNQNLYGELNIKPDREVTAEDIAQRHLVLIGSAAQNSIVAGIAARLPVSYADDTIRWSDGQRSSARDRALGLVHYNPDAPNRLIFWVAASDPAAYAAGSLAPELLGNLPTGADAVVVRVSDPSLVESRSFDSRWRWLPREQSPLLPAELASSADLDRAVAASVRRAAPADFALTGLPEPSRPNAFEPGEARLADLLAQNYFVPVGVMTLLGSELMAAMQAIAPSNAGFEPVPDPTKLEREREYRVALSARQITPFVRLTHLAPRKFEMVDNSVARALTRYGVPGAVRGAARTPDVAASPKPPASGELGAKNGAVTASAAAVRTSAPAP